MAYHDSDMKAIKQAGIQQLLDYLTHNQDLVLQCRENGRWDLLNANELSDGKEALCSDTRLSSGRNAAELMTAMGIRDL